MCTVWLANTRDPLIFRNGKPFSADPGSRAETLPIPFPGTITGALRTLYGTDPQTGVFGPKTIRDSYQVFGPFLVELNEDNQIKEWFFPAPQDAVFFDQEGAANNTAELRDLKPLSLPADVMLDTEGMNVCGFKSHEKQKSHRTPPAFWNWKSFKKWLIDPSEEKDVNLDEIGIRPLPVQTRMHVSISSSTQAYEDGALFQTSAVEFDIPKTSAQTLREVRHFGIAALTDLNIPNGGPGFLGGEKRMVYWQKVESTPDFLTCPEEIRGSILKTGCCRLILLTPGYFEGSKLPPDCISKWGDKFEVVASINQRFQAVSGWDYVSRCPKASNFLVPAGSVFFIRLKEKLEEGVDRKQVLKEFIEAHWAKTVCENSHMSGDGYGFAVLGAWDVDPEDANAPDAKRKLRLMKEARNDKQKSS
jgi:CRISPR-associated protein Cmr3